MQHRIVLVLSLAAALCATAVRRVQAREETAERLFTTEHTAMATRWQLLLYSTDASRAEGVSTAVFEEVDRIEALLTNYSTQSELSRLNQRAAQQTVVTDPETFGFLQSAQHWSRASEGAFDITVGPLMRAWGFYRKAGRLPTRGESAALKRQVGWRNVELDPMTRGVRFARRGVELDPGGIGKGFAVDAVMHLLREQGVRTAMISAGSSTIGAMGAPPGTAGWRVNSHDPWQPQRFVSSVLLRDSTLSTANCAEKNFMLAGHRWCHIMNPRTLRPVEGMQQVTIIDTFGTASDALSNALFVLGPTGSTRLLRTLPQDRALLVSGDEDRRVCTAIRWREPIAPGFCARTVEVR